MAVGLLLLILIVLVANWWETKQAKEKLEVIATSLDMVDRRVQIVQGKPLSGVS